MIRKFYEFAGLGGGGSDSIPEFKKITTQLGTMLTIAVPMIEELVENKMFPACIIGIDATKLESINPSNKNHIIPARFATLCDEHDIVILDICKQLLESHGYKVSKP